MTRSARSHSEPDRTISARRRVCPTTRRAPCAPRGGTDDDPRRAVVVERPAPRRRDELSGVLVSLGQDELQSGGWNASNQVDRDAAPFVTFTRAIDVEVEPRCMTEHRPHARELRNPVPSRTRNQMTHACIRGK